jgi:ubiquinone/menaquinone biosynthesis C-methylase UbiE
MGSVSGDAAFAGSIPELYDKLLVPLIFEPYAKDLARRLAERAPTRILEVAAGTGVLTRAMASLLPANAAIVATDLNQAMLDRAAAIGTARPVTWRPADAMSLPFADAEFDAVVCQFGAMFFPDKAKAFAEARRVLRPSGTFLFNVWDRIEENEFADTVTTAVASLFPEDRPRFLARTPHGYHDVEVIRRDIAAAGFATRAEITMLAARSVADSARIPAMAYCEGTPLRAEIEARDRSKLGDATQAAADAIVRRFGAGRVDGKIQAFVISVAK